MKSWTRTLNFDDAHTLLALTWPGQRIGAWSQACRPHLAHLSTDRQREVLRLLRDGFLEIEDGTIADGLFLRFYHHAPATAQLDILLAQWALTHPISLLAVEALVVPALRDGPQLIPLPTVEALVRAHLATRSAESIRKTRTVLLRALDGVGAMITRGTGQHRSIRASRGQPHPMAFSYLVVRELRERRATDMSHRQAVHDSLPVRLTRCEPAYAEWCLGWGIEAGVLARHGDRVEPAWLGGPTTSAPEADGPPAIRPLRDDRTRGPRSLPPFSV